MVSSTITLYSDKWVMNFLWWSLCVVYKCEISLCCLPEINIILYVSYTLIKKSFILQDEKFFKNLREEEPPCVSACPHSLSSSCVPSKKDTDHWYGLVMEYFAWAPGICKVLQSSSKEGLEWFENEKITWL